ncbi:MAG TPA: hypothetical protein VM681_08780 [Candidatus Thermoplasmatota archaeon]|nr:hypothetical protein [Candidatus Thermoplasmatota archaeon]
MNARLAARLDQAASLAEIFEVVKRAAAQVLKQERAGLMLALADLGNAPGGFFGGFHYVGSNYIVMNKLPLLRIRDTRPELYNAYAFHVLLHEYIHTLGVLDERRTRELALRVSQAVFGPEHVATRIAGNIEEFFPNLVFPDVTWRPEALHLEIDKSFGIGDASYIQ